MESPFYSIYVFPSLIPTIRRCLGHRDRCNRFRVLYVFQEVSRKLDRQPPAILSRRYFHEHNLLEWCEKSIASRENHIQRTPGVLKLSEIPLHTNFNSDLMAFPRACSCEGTDLCFLVVRTSVLLGDVPDISLLMGLLVL